MVKQNLNLTEIKKLNPRLEKIFDKLILQLIKNHLIGSTLVEGSTFTETEAIKVLDGETIHGHTVDEHLELINARECASYIHRLFFQRERITVKHLDRAHRILLAGVGNPGQKNPGENRGAVNKSAYTILIDGGKRKRFEYENPLKIKADYSAFIDFHINQVLSAERVCWVEQLAKLYFHFQMLHPYCDGNGRLGRLLVSAKAAAEKGEFLRFNLEDGPEHLEIMMNLTIAYNKNKKQTDYKKLINFFNLHLVEHD